MDAVNSVQGTPLVPVTGGQVAEGQPVAVVPLRHQTTLLIADGNRLRKDTLAANFAADGYRVLTAASGESAVEILARERVAVLMIDAALVRGPETALLVAIRTGLPVLGIRARDREIPIITTAAVRDDLACIRALDAGSDDWVCGPFTYLELRARVRALIRRQLRGLRGARLRVGPLEVDAVSRQAWVQGAELMLSAKEFSLLRVLATDPTRMFTRAELLETVWGWTPARMVQASTRTLDSHASRLRRKLRAAGVEFVLVVWGEGYKLCDATALVEAESADAEATVELPHAA